MPDVQFSKRVQGGGSVMVWIGFSAVDKTPIIFVNTTMKSEDYIEMIERSLIPFAQQIYQKIIFFSKIMPLVTGRKRLCYGWKVKESTFYRGFQEAQT